MFNIVFLVVAFGVSIFVASLTIRRQKGEDWYSPISNNEKMVESIINISIVLIILTTIFKYIILNLRLFFLLLILIVLITTTFIVSSKINKSHNKSTKNDRRTDSRKTLRDLLTRFITVYNVLYFILSIIHLSIMAKYSIENLNLFTSLEDTLKPTFEINSTLVVSFTILTWTSLIGTTISLFGWAFSNNVDAIEKKEKVNYKFFVNRVMERNKKSRS